MSPMRLVAAVGIALVLGGCSDGGGTLSEQNADWASAILLNGITDEQRHELYVEYAPACSDEQVLTRLAVHAADAGTDTVMMGMNVLSAVCPRQVPRWLELTAAPNSR